MIDDDDGYNNDSPDYHIVQFVCMSISLSVPSIIVESVVAWFVERAQQKDSSCLSNHPNHSVFVTNVTAS